MDMIYLSLVIGLTSGIVVPGGIKYHNRNETIISDISQRILYAPHLMPSGVPAYDISF